MDDKVVEKPITMYRVVHKNGQNVLGSGSLSGSKKLFTKAGYAKAALTKAQAGNEYYSRSRFMKDRGYKYDDMYKPSVMAEYSAYRQVEVDAAAADYTIIEYILQPVAEYDAETFRNV